MHDVRDAKDLDKFINFYREKVEYNVLSGDMTESAREYIIRFGDLAIPAQVILKQKLVSFMVSIGSRFRSVKREAEAVAGKWQQQVNLWLKENNLTEKQYIELQSAKPQKHLSPHFPNRKSSGSSDRPMYRNSSSYEIESPDSQKASSNCSQEFNRHSSNQKSSSPLQIDTSTMHRTKSAEFNINLNIDTRDEIPNNQTHESSVRHQDRSQIGSIEMGRGMFRAIKSGKPVRESDVSLFVSVCENQLKLPKSNYPSYALEYKEKESSSTKTKNGDSYSKNHVLNAKSLNGKNDKKLKSPHKSHNVLPAPRDINGSSRSCPDQKRKHIENTQSPVSKHKEQTKNRPLSQECTNLLSSLQQGAGTTSNGYPVSKDDRNKNHMATNQSDGKVKEWRKDHRSSQNIKSMPSISQSLTTESLPSFPASKCSNQQNGQVSSHSAATAKKMKEERSPSQNSKQKHVAYSDYVANGRHVKLSTEGFRKLEDLKNTKGACAMALEARNCDKNHIKKKDSPSESAMLAITSSKKERTSVYHGKKSEGRGVEPLKDLSIAFMLKWLKQNSDISRMLNKPVTFEVLEPVLVLLGPEKLLKVEEVFQSLKRDTDNIWRMLCQKFSSQFHLKKEKESWRTFYQRCCMESDKKLRHVAASISSASKAKSSRQIMLTTVDCPPTKRQKTDHPVVAKNNSAIKPQPNSCHPSNSRSDTSVPVKGMSNHAKPSHKTVKKDAPLMHKVKKTLGQMSRLHRTSNQGH